MPLLAIQAEKCVLQPKSSEDQGNMALTQRPIHIKHHALQPRQLRRSITILRLAQRREPAGLIRLHGA